MSELPTRGVATSKNHAASPAVPLDLRCNSGDSTRPAAFPSPRGYAASVSRRCAPPTMPANAAPSTTLSRGGLSSIVTTMKLGRRHSADGQTTAESSTPRKRSRNSASAQAAATPVEKLARISSPASVSVQQSAVNSSASVQVFPPAAGASSDQLSGCQASACDSLPQSRTAVPVADDVATSNAVPVPVVLTSVGGMLVPLSSAPAAIIVVNCAAATSPLPSQSVNRLCPIAPAPPPVTKRTAAATTMSSTVSPVSSQSGTTVSVSSATQRRMYKCEEPGCGKTYFKNSHLKVHRRVHTGMQLAHCCCIK